MVPHLVVSPMDRVQERWVNVAILVPVGAELDLPRGISVRRVEFESPDGLETEGMGKGLRVVVQVARPDQVSSVEQVRQARPDLNLWVRPTADFLAVTKAAGQVKIPVLFSDSVSQLLGTDLGLELLDYYLFEPSLAVPIEPFHSLLRADLGENRTLWNIWFGRPREHFFVDRDGRVSLCAGWAEDEARLYGRDDGSPRDWAGSDGHRFLEDFLSGKALPEVCRGCSVRKLCRGAALAVSGAESCAAWPEILTRVDLAAGSMKPRRSDSQKKSQS